MNFAKNLRFIGLGCLALLLAACAEGPARRDDGEPQVVHYTVQRGDTLYSIAFRHGSDFKQLAAQNKIAPPYRIFPGQKLTIITRDKELSSQAEQVAPVWTEGRQGPQGESFEERPFSYGAPAQPARPEPREREPKPAREAAPGPKPAPPENDSPPAKSNFAWRWPTEGKVVQTFSPANDKKGIDIGGHEGQAVLASAAGDVVYSGSGLIGYGNLVIIKHDENFLSAYGHNKNLLVKQGDKVKAGQKIAEMGQTPKDGSILHFEIRRDGKPVDPLRYLPK